MTYHVVITGPAKRDIHEALTWWSKHRSSEQAERWYSKIYPAIPTLSAEPERCPIAPETDLLESGLRQLRFGVRRKTTHRILFTIVGQEVRILRIRHVAQKLLDLDDLL
jgi:plasmid stabilization system protein ParE